MQVSGYRLFALDGHFPYNFDDKLHSLTWGAVGTLGQTGWARQRGFRRMAAAPIFDACRVALDDFPVVFLDSNRILRMAPYS